MAEEVGDGLDTALIRFNWIRFVAALPKRCPNLAYQFDPLCRRRQKAPAVCAVKRT